MAFCKIELSKLQLCQTFMHTVFPVLHLCHLMSVSHYDPNETVNSPITRVEMSIIIQPKVAAEEISWLPDQWQTWQHSNLHKEDLNTDHIMYQSESVVLGQRNTTIICRLFSSPSSLLLSSNLPAQPLRQQAALLHGAATPTSL